MKLIAHRGLWSDSVKENSYESCFLGLTSDKYIGIECDVRMTKDKVFILYHDPLYKGILIKNIYYKKIKKDVTRLNEVINIKTNKIILLEIKDFNIDLKRLLKLLRNKENIYIMSFSTKVITNIRKLTNKHKVGVLNYVINSSDNYNFDFICLLDIIATPHIINVFNKKNIECIIYGTIKPNKNYTYIIDDEKLDNK